jgi:hypothetical protein
MSRKPKRAPRQRVGNGVSIGTEFLQPVDTLLSVSILPDWQHSWDRAGGPVRALLEASERSLNSSRGQKSTF